MKDILKTQFFLNLEFWSEKKWLHFRFKYENRSGHYEGLHKVIQNCKSFSYIRTTKLNYVEKLSFIRPQKLPARKFV